MDLKRIEETIKEKAKDGKLPCASKLPKNLEFRIRRWGRS
jgi:hypothetical protein